MGGAPFIVRVACAVEAALGRLVILSEPGGASQASELGIEPVTFASAYVPALSRVLDGQAGAGELGPGVDRLAELLRNGLVELQVADPGAPVEESLLRAMRRLHPTDAGTGAAEQRYAAEVADLLGGSRLVNSSVSVPVQLIVGDGVTQTVEDLRDLTAAPGVTVVLGPSGSGKTHQLHTLVKDLGLGRGHAGIVPVLLDASLVNPKELDLDALVRASAVRVAASAGLSAFDIDSVSRVVHRAYGDGALLVIADGVERWPPGQAEALMLTIRIGAQRSPLYSVVVCTSDPAFAGLLGGAARIARVPSLRRHQQIALLNAVSSDRPGTRGLDALHSAGMAELCERPLWMTVLALAPFASSSTKEHGPAAVLLNALPGFDGRRLGSDGSLGIDAMAAGRAAWKLIGEGSRVRMSWTGAEIREALTEASRIVNVNVNVNR